MTCLISPFKGQEFSSVNKAIDVLKEYIYSETPLDIELIYFTAYQNEEKLFVLNFLLTGYLERDKQSVAILDGITKYEADESWIRIFK